MHRFTRLATAVLALAALLLPLACASSKPREERRAEVPPTLQPIDITPERLASSDYGIFLKIIRNTPARVPDEEEKAALGPLWPDTPVGMNAAFFFTLAGAQMKPVQQAPAGSVFADAAYGGQVEALADWVEANRFALGSFDLGVTQDTCRLPVFIADMRRGRVEQRVPMPPMLALKLIRYASGLNEDRAFLHELKGRPDPAAEAWLSGLRAGRALQSRALLIEQLVGGAMLLNAGDGLARLIASAELSEDMLRAIIDQAARAEITPDEMASVWRRESILQRFIYTRGVGDSRAAWKALWAPAPWQAKGVKRPEVPDREVFTAVLPSAQRAIENILKRPLSQLVTGDPGVYELIHRLAPGAGPAWIYYLQFGPIIDEWANMAAQQNVEMRALQVRAAVALYTRKHAKAPDKLADLAPEFLAAVPADPFSGEPLQYARGEGTWAVWSVGVDLENNAGANTSPANPWDGPDAVFFSRRLSTEQMRQGFTLVRNDGETTVVKPEPPEELKEDE